MIDKKRKAQLGIGDDEDEYDLYRALDVNTDKGGGGTCAILFTYYYFSVTKLMLIYLISYLYYLTI